jgi:hypothetical protein
MEDVRREATEHFPDGGEIACYYPDDQRLMFIRHAGRGLFDSAGEVIHSSTGQTVGMIVDLLNKDPDWTDRLTSMSTTKVEDQPVFG